MLTFNPSVKTVGLPVGFNNLYETFDDPNRLFELCYNEVLFRGFVKPFHAPPICGLYFNLGNQFEYTCPVSDQETTFFANHFCLVYLPETQESPCRVHGLHRSLVFNICHDVLQCWAAEYSVLNDLLKSVKAQKPFVFPRRPVHLAPENSKWVNVVAAKGHSEETMFLTSQLLFLNCLDCLKNAKVKSRPAGEFEPEYFSDEMTLLLKRTEYFLKKHLNLRLTLNELASVMETSKPLLNNLFHAHHNKSLMAWFADERLQAAQGMLLTDSQPIQHIARSVGYSGARSFSKAYECRYGYSPTVARMAEIESEFRKK